MLDATLKILGTLLGLVGAVLGIYNYVHARRKEARELKEKEAAKDQEQLEWKFYTNFLQLARDGYVLNPEDGSEQHRMAERLLIRLPPNMGGYAVPGQSYLVDTGSKSEK